MGKVSSIFRALALVIFPIASPAFAQLQTETINRLYTIAAELQGQAHSLERGGDLNGDGVADIIALVRNSTGGTGAVAAFDGKHGKRLWVNASAGLTIGGTPFGNNPASHIAVLGDINGDQKNDILVGAPQTSNGGLSYSGRAAVFSGGNGSVLFAFDGIRASGYFGSSVVAPGDLTGDGVSDAVVCGRAVPENQGSLVAPYCRAYSLGSGGGVLWHIDGAPRDGFGGAVTAINDVNGDGRNDLILTRVYAASSAGVAQVGAISVRSGATGQVITEFFGSTMYEQLGRTASSLGDLNGDGRIDFLVTSGSSVVPNQARIFSVINGAVTPRFVLPIQPGETVTSAASIQDVSRDGTRDILVGFPYLITNSSYRGQARIYSGFNGQSLKVIDNGNAVENFGMVVREVGDSNNDGDDEFAILGTWGTSSFGGISVYSLGNKNQALFGCGSSSATINVIGTPLPGNTITFRAEVPEASGGIGAFLVSYKSYEAAGIDVNYQSQLDCRTGINFGAPTSHQSSPLQVVDSTGSISFEFPIPALSALRGMEIIVEGWFLGLNGQLYSPQSVIVQVE